MLARQTGTQAISTLQGSDSRSVTLSYPKELYNALFPPVIGEQSASDGPWGLTTKQSTEEEEDEEER
jgi:hypothetical protein